MLSKAVSCEAASAPVSRNLWIKGLAMRWNCGGVSRIPLRSGIRFLPKRPNRNTESCQSPVGRSTGTCPRAGVRNEAPSPSAFIRGSAEACLRATRSETALRCLHFTIHGNPPALGGPKGRTVAAVRQSTGACHRVAWAETTLRCLHSVIQENPPALGDPK